MWTALLAGVVAAPAGWLVTDHLESRNEFCTSCHLDVGTPLHEPKMIDFLHQPAESLVSAHHAADAGFRCIDCHGGASFPNKLRVKTVAARDALMYVLGRFDEPEDMEYPLWNEDCVQCHPRYSPERDDAFHAVAVHNLPGFAYECVKCHLAHPTGRKASLDYLEPEPTVAVCRNCHEEF